MIEWTLTTEDVARIQFAISPLWELVLSLVVLRAPGRHALHVPWVQWARPRLGRLDLRELFALAPIHGIIADFLTPTPTSRLPDIASQLELVRYTTAARLIEDLAEVPGIPGPIHERLRQNPEAAAARIATTLQEYWDTALAEYWPRLRDHLEADILWRSRRLASDGTRAVFDDLHDTVVWRGDRVAASDPWSYSGKLAGKGLLLVPSAMAWPTVRKMVEPHQPTIVYPARGLATLWETEPPTVAAPLAALLGRTRARLLAALAEPTSTTVLARQLSVTPGAASQHLSVLLSSGLVTRTRLGGTVLYGRTQTGNTLAGWDQGVRRSEATGRTDSTAV